VLKKFCLAIALFIFASRTRIVNAQATAQTPNIVLILADDVGYGDLSCYGATKVSTPNLDKLAAGGVRFTDAHSPAATCTPSRYALLTGQYAFRTKGVHILPGDASLLIDPARPTLPRFLQHNGYATACIGKWHLGLGDSTKGPIDWNGNIAPGPLEVGFDYSFIIPATGDRVPCVYVENHRVVGFDPNDPIAVSYNLKVGNDPTGAEHPEMLKMDAGKTHLGTIVNGVSRIGYMSGGQAARWKDDQIAATLTNHATDFVASHKDRRFFLYFATHDIHVPRVPEARFVGSSQCGIRGDAIQELDWSVGQVMATLDKLNLTSNTLVIFASDNGPVVHDGYDDGSDRNLNGHKPAGPFRGGKYSIFEGGTRTPLITFWPGHIQPGVSDALLCHVDFFASFAAQLLQKPSTADVGADSVDVRAALLGTTTKGREELVEEAGVLALRRGNWKFIPRVAHPPAAPRGESNVDQLYDLATDIAESHNVAAEHLDIVRELSDELKRLRGR